MNAKPATHHARTVAVPVKKNTPPLECIDLRPAARLVRASGVNGEVYHVLSTEVASVTPIHCHGGPGSTVPGRCIVRLRDGKWIELALEPGAAAAAIWGLS